MLASRDQEVEDAVPAKEIFAVQSLRPCAGAELEIAIRWPVQFSSQRRDSLCFQPLPHLSPPHTFLQHSLNPGLPRAKGECLAGGWRNKKFGVLPVSPSLQYGEGRQLG